MAARVIPPRERVGRSLLVLVLLVTTFATGCGQQTISERHPGSEVSALDLRAPFLKAYMKDGSRYEFSSWRVDSTASHVYGFGKLFDARGTAIRQGSVVVPTDSVAVFETNRAEGMPPALQAITIVIVIAAAAVAIAYLAKAIFGSCPTFYADHDGEPMLVAEGFSSSIAPPLEATDVDAMYRIAARSRDLEIVMKNEALETHVVRSVHVLAAPRGEAGRVLASTRGTFRRATQLLPPDRARGEEGDCLAALRAADGEERFSHVDSTDLASHESLDLEFDRVPTGDLGLVIGARQTLLSTFLLYRSLAYMGSATGSYLAAYERSAGAKRHAIDERVSGISRALGGIDVMVPDARGRWTKVGRSKETGPLATDTRVVPLPRPASGPLRVRLWLTRGDWRIDYVALAALGETVEPLRIEPSVVYRGDREDEAARASLVDSTRVLVTSPGDEYRMVFRLPEDYANQELFLESRGYYLEWLRQDWLAQESPGKSAAMLSNPRKALRQLAPEFARREAAFENEFWNSRYGHPKPAESGSEPR